MVIKYIAEKVLKRCSGSWLTLIIHINSTFKKALLNSQTNELNKSENVIYVVHSQRRTYHNGKEPDPQRKLLEAMAGRIRLSWHLCWGGHVWCAYWRHIRHRRRDVVDSHDNGQQLDYTHTVGRCVLPHFLVPLLCSPDGVSLPFTSLKRDCFVYSSSRKPEEELLGSVLLAHHLRHRSVSAGDLVENTLLK